MHEPDFTPHKESQTSPVPSAGSQDERSAISAGADDAPVVLRERFIPNEPSYHTISEALGADLRQAPQSIIVLGTEQMVEIRGLKLAVCDLDMTLLRTGEYHDGPNGRFAHSLRSLLRELGHDYNNEDWLAYWEGNKAVGKPDHVPTYSSIQEVSFSLDQRVCNLIDETKRPLPEEAYVEISKAKDQLVALGSEPVDQIQVRSIVNDLGVRVCGIIESRICFSKKDWEWLWEGESALRRNGFRSASGQSEDDVFKSLVDMAKLGLGVDLNTDRAVAGDDKLTRAGPRGVERLKHLNEVFIEDHFELHHHLIEVIGSARDLVNEFHSIGGRLGLCTASGETFLRKLMEIAEYENFGNEARPGIIDNRFSFLKRFDCFRSNADKRVGPDEYSGASVRDICDRARVDPNDSAMFGDGINDFGAASNAGIPIVVLAINSEGDEHIENVRRILAQVEAAIKKAPGLSSTTLVIANTFDQVLFKDRLEGEGAVSWAVATRAELNPPVPTLNERV